MNAHEDLLHDVVDVRSGSHAARDVWPQSGLDVAPCAAGFRWDQSLRSYVQHEGAQQFAPPGFLPSIIADAR